MDAVVGFKPIEPPNLHFLQAAIGWLELGNNREAIQELEKISPELNSHPEVLRVRWRVVVRSGDVQSAMALAQSLLSRRATLAPSASLPRPEDSQSLPDSDAAALAEAGFPLLFAIPYNLACYACRLGNVNEAWDWFQIALEMGDLEGTRQLALRDPDLEILWPRILSL